MPTVFSHALLGAAIAGASGERVQRRRLVLVCVAAAVAPDLDVAAFALGIPYEHPLGHRGVTHGLPFAVAAGWLLSRAGFQQRRRAFAAIALAMASHGVLDALTNGGLGVGFAVPFSMDRFFAPWRPIQVSPIGVDRFFSGDALGVLVSEARVVGPLLVLLAIAAFLRLRLAPLREARE